MVPHDSKSDLPLKIFSYLDFEDVMSCSKLNYRMEYICSDEYLWKKFTEIKLDYSDMTEEEVNYLTNNLTPELRKLSLAHLDKVTDDHIIPIVSTYHIKICYIL